MFDNAFIPQNQNTIAPEVDAEYFCSNDLIYGLGQLQDQDLSLGLGDYTFAGDSTGIVDNWQNCWDSCGVEPHETTSEAVPQPVSQPEVHAQSENSFASPANHDLPSVSEEWKRDVIYRTALLEHRLEQVVGSMSASKPCELAEQLRMLEQRLIKVEGIVHDLGIG